MGSAGAKGGVVPASTYIPVARDGASRTPETELNWLLRDLPSDEYELLAPHMQRGRLKTLELLSEAGSRLDHAYFPETSIISVVRPVDGTVVEAGTIGREGMAGLAVLFGVNWTPATLLGQIPGTCTRVAFGTLEALLPRVPELRRRIGRFVLSFLDQVGQTVACNARHSVDQRCARWLLLTRDRMDGDTFRLTHEVLAQMLGVRRAGVSVAANALKRAGAIRYTRGSVTILDRVKLEEQACECYEINRTHLTRLLGDGVLRDV